jgi:hypothetical protein
MHQLILHNIRKSDLCPTSIKHKTSQSHGLSLTLTLTSKEFYLLSDVALHNQPEKSLCYAQMLRLCAGQPSL